MIKTHVKPANMRVLCLKHQFDTQKLVLSDIWFTSCSLVKLAEHQIMHIKWQCVCSISPHKKKKKTCLKLVKIHHGSVFLGKHLGNSKISHQFPSPRSPFPKILDRFTTFANEKPHLKQSFQDNFTRKMGRLIMDDHGS